MTKGEAVDRNTKKPEEGKAAAAIVALALADVEKPKKGNLLSLGRGSWIFIFLCRAADCSHGKHLLNLPIESWSFIIIMNHDCNVRHNDVKSFGEAEGVAMAFVSTGLIMRSEKNFDWLEIIYFILVNYTATQLLISCQQMFFSVFGNFRSLRSNFFHENLSKCTLFTWKAGVDLSGTRV